MGMPGQTSPLPQTETDATGFTSYTGYPLFAVEDSPFSAYLVSAD